MRHPLRVATVLLLLLLLLGWLPITQAGERADERADVQADEQAARGADFDPLRDSLARSEPQPIYAADPKDAWNQVFFLLFTRTIPARLSADGAGVFAAGDDRLRLSERRVTRIESGDRAIDPLYPSWVWMSSTAFDFEPNRPWRILREPQYSRFVAALEGVRRTATSRPPLARALMQADLWSAYDMLHTPATLRRDWSRSTPDGAEGERAQRAQTLLASLASTMRALALSREEIARLPDNYADAARSLKLPDLLGDSGTKSGKDAGNNSGNNSGKNSGTNSGNASDWMEVRWLEHRSHDEAAGRRRATRVFVQPAARPDDATAFLNQLRDRHGADGEALRSVALLIQLLLVASDGTVVPSRITYDVQFRGAAAARANGGARIPQYELSRRRLLSSSASSASSASTPGGLIGFAADMPAYLPIAGNDLSFAAPPRLDGEAVLVPLESRCTLCHGDGPGVGRLVTFAMHAPSQGPPPVERLVSGDNLHPADVARRKMTQEDFKSLQQHWRQALPIHDGNR